MVMTERADWLERRKLGVGGSDIGALLGLSKWSSPWSLWCEKVGLLPPSPMTERQQIGHDAEVFLSGIFTRRTGLAVAGEQMEATHLEHTYARATLDGIVTDESGAWLGTVQFKTTAERSWSAIPPAIVAQCQWEMGVAGLPRCWLVVGFAGWEIEIHQILFDPEDWAFMLTAAAEFWEMVESRTPPDLDGSEATTDALAIVYANGAPDTSVSLDDLVDELRRRKTLTTLIADMEREVDDIKNNVRGALGTAELGTIDGTLAATWTTQAGRKTTCPACGHLEQGKSSRVLRFKNIKEST